MTAYRVKLTFKYSDVVHVQAMDRRDAETKALEQCREEYECFYDSEITEEDDENDHH